MSSPPPLPATNTAPPSSDSGHGGAPRPEREDRRVARTRRTLRAALVELVIERGWEGVSVLDVCARADVGRSTFYAHFADKEDLLLSGFDTLAIELRAAPAPGPLPFVRPLVEHALEHRRLFRVLLGTPSGRKVQNRFRALMVELVCEAHATSPGAARFVAGGCIEVLAAALDQPGTRADALVAEMEGLAARVLGP